MRMCLERGGGEKVKSQFSSQSYLHEGKLTVQMSNRGVV